MPLSIEIPNPTNIETSVAYLIQGREEPYARLVLSDFPLDGGLFSAGQVRTDMVLASGRVLYSFSTILYQGYSGKNREDLGFYTSERVKKIQDSLREQEVLTEVVDSGLCKELTQVIVKGEGDQGVVIDFGFKSHRDSGFNARDRIDFFREVSEESKQYEMRRAIRRSNEPNQEPLTWHMTDPNNPVDYQSFDFAYALANGRFEDHLSYYGETSLKILRALYQEAELNGPDRNIVLSAS